MRPRLFRIVNTVRNLDIALGNNGKIFEAICVLVLSVGVLIFNAMVIVVLDGVFLLGDLRVRAGRGLRGINFQHA